MAAKSPIQWTDATWNIARGCSKVDEDCKYCYMFRDSFNNTRYEPQKVVRTKTVFNLPLKIKESSKIFTCSLTDFFHMDCDHFRNEAWEIIKKCPHHQFQILTKRPERIIEQMPDEMKYAKANNVWLGTSIGSQSAIHRLQTLLSVPYNGIRFLSLEPLYGKIDLEILLSDVNQSPTRKIDWVIIGGESGNDTGKYRFRPCKLEWIESIVEQCKVLNIAVFIKQMGTHLAKELRMTDRHGGNMAEFPKHLQIREFPKL